MDVSVGWVGFLSVWNGFVERMRIVAECCGLFKDIVLSQFPED